MNDAAPLTKAMGLFTAADVAARARERLSLDLPNDIFTRPMPKTGDHNLNREKFAYAGVGKPSAVLVPIVDHADGASVLLTQRTSALRSHAGQIAFPGGRMDPEDATPVDTALREAFEEIGLMAGDAEPVGYLDVYQTGTGYRVVPVLAIVRPGLQWRLNPDEVEAAFEVPLAFLMQAENRQLHEREFNGVMRSFYAFPYGERYIWGATAGMLQNLHDRLYL